MNPYSGKVENDGAGKREWGRTRGLYPKKVEQALNVELENKIGPIYERMIRFKDLAEEERELWAQFLLSQLVRTPTFLRYEEWTKKYYGLAGEPANPLVGCQQCEDLRFVLDRPWRFFVAHEDDHFIRTDNPVFQTGFIERERSCLYYPLTPKICFVACSVENGWWERADLVHPTEMGGYKLEKGDTWFLNFYLARSAERTLIASPSANKSLGDHMFEEVLGSYPQAPFSLQLYERNEEKAAYESVRLIQSKCDDEDYPHWSSSEFEPFFISPAERTAI